MENFYYYCPIILSVLLAVTLHEAAHGFVAYFFGDSTAKNLGRVTLNPLSHIDPVGTIFLPGLLILSHAPFLFGYAKPVPVHFASLHPLRLGAICVAAAGPAANLIIAIGASLLAHTSIIDTEFGQNFCVYSFQVNIVLAAFNLLPLLPLDGGRIVTFLLPPSLAGLFSKTEKYGMLVLLALFLMPSLSAWTGHTIDPLRSVLIPITEFFKYIILAITG